MIEIFRDAAATRARGRLSRLFALAVCTTMLSTGCAFFGKSEPLQPRFYTPEAADTSRTSAAPDPTLLLRLGRVQSGSDLREAIAFRSSAHEVGFYETRRWTERPEVYVRRAVDRALFERRGVVHVVSGPAPLVALELLEFSELRKPSRAARVSVRAVLSDGRTVRLEQTFTETVEVTGADNDFEPIIEAMASALALVVERLADAVVSALRADVTQMPAPGAAAPR